MSCAKPKPPASVGNRSFVDTVSSASIRGADTVPARSRGYDAGKRVNGRKWHLAVDTGGLLLAVVVTTAGIQDWEATARSGAGE